MCIDSDILIVVLSLPIVLVVLWFLSEPNQKPTTLEGAKLAIANISEWGKWMAGIQTAGIAALAYFVFDGRGITQALELNPLQRIAALVGFVYSGAALFFSAWVLSALPSLAIRIHSHSEEISKSTDAVFDIYELTLFDYPGLMGGPRFAYLLMVKHWLWAIGLLGIGCFTLTLFACSPGNSNGKITNQPKVDISKNTPKEYSSGNTGAASKQGKG